MITKPRRTLVISNISGGLKALQQCLLASKYNQATDKLIFLGDYVGKLGHNPETIEALLWFKRTAKFPPVFIEGDTDRWTKDWLKTGKANLYWLGTNGKEVVKQYIKSQYLADPNHLEFFQYSKPFYVDDENRLFVHAGFDSEKGVGNAYYTTSYYFNQSLWRSSVSNPKEYYVTKRGSVKQFRSYLYKEIFIGHVPTIDSAYTKYTPETKHYKGHIGHLIDKPMKRRNIYNINTGAEFGFPLTIMDIDSKQIWQSKPTREIYRKRAV